MKPAMKHVTFKVPQELIEHLEEVKEQTGETMSDIVRRYLEAYVESRKEKAP